MAPDLLRLLQTPLQPAVVGDQEDLLDVPLPGTRSRVTGIRLRSGAKAAIGLRIFTSWCSYLHPGVAQGENRRNFDPKHPIGPQLSSKHQLPHLWCLVGSGSPVQTFHQVNDSDGTALCCRGLGCTGFGSSWVPNQPTQRLNWEWAGGAGGMLGLGRA